MEWYADSTFRDEQMAAYLGQGGYLEVFFPKREDIDKPGEMIDAMLAVTTHETWPLDLDLPINAVTAQHIIYTVAMIDSLHEMLESVKIDGKRPLNPHLANEDPAWGVLMDIANDAVKRLMKEYPRA